MANVRRFDSADGYAFEGAENFSDGSVPFIAEETWAELSLTVVGDSQGISVMLNGAQDEPVTSWSSMREETPALMEILVERVQSLFWQKMVESYFKYDPEYAALLSKLNPLAESLGFDEI